MKNLKLNGMISLMTVSISLLTLFSCIEGVFNESIYNALMKLGRLTHTLRMGSISQDMIFIPLAVLLLVVSLKNMVKPGLKAFILMMGITGNFFYGFGLYVIQAQYTSLYLVYLFIFSLSVYTLVFGLTSIVSRDAGKLSMPKGTRIAIAIFFLSMVIMLGTVWLIRVIGDVQKHMPGETYGVFVLDLGIVFPAIAITALFLLFNKPISNILAGVMLVKVFTVCFSWGFSEWYVRVADNYVGSFDMLVIPSVLTVISSVFIIFFMKNLRVVTS